MPHIHMWGIGKGTIHSWAFKSFGQTFKVIGKRMAAFPTTPNGWEDRLWLLSAIARSKTRILLLERYMFEDNLIHGSLLLPHVYTSGKPLPGISRRMIMANTSSALMSNTLKRR